MKVSEFTKSGGCLSKSAEVLLTKTATNRHFDEAIIWKDFCKDVISDNFEFSSKDDLFDEVAASYSDSNIDEVEETQVSYVSKLANQIYRYYKSEHRKTVPGKEIIILPEEPIYLDITDMITTDFDGADNIECRIDVIDRNVEKKIIEGIIYKKGLPKLGKTSSAYKNVNNEIPLQLMRLALRKYADTVLEEGESVTIIASYYYAAKTSDRTDSNYIDDYFDTACPIRSLSETYTKLADGEKYGDDKHPYNDNDKALIELLDKWATGYEKCDLDEEKDCKVCKDYRICHYNSAPKKIEEKKSVKKREKVALTDEQKTIVVAKKGIFICNAVPGSGKTETAIKQRTVSIILNELNDLVARYQNGENVVVEKAAEFITMDSRR